MLVTRYKTAVALPSPHCLTFPHTGPTGARAKGYILDNLTFRDQSGNSVVFPGTQLTAQSTASTYSCERLVGA